MAGDERRAAHADGRKRRLRHDGTIGVDQANVAQPEHHPGAVGGALQYGVVDVHVQVGELTVDGVLDQRNEARQRNRAAAQPAVARDDRNQADDQDAGEDLAAHMGAARGQFAQLELDRLGNSLRQGPAPGVKRKKRPAALGEDDESAARLGARALM